MTNLYLGTVWRDTVGKSNQEGRTAVDSLKDKRIVIVGASSGIGAQTAITLSRHGAKIILLARREDKLKEVLSKLESEGHGYYRFDVTNVNRIEDVVKQVVNDYGRIDGLVYTAAVAGDCPILQLTYERHMNLFNINYFPFVEFVRQIAKKGRYSENGLRVVSISSVAAFFGDRAHLSYSASKAAMDGAIRCMAKELAPKGICVNSIAPSWVRTDMTEEYIERNGKESATVKNMLPRQYLGMGEPEDIANAVAFLISPEARFITGTTLFADGGYSVS